MDRREIAHAWAHQTRSKYNSGNFFFNGKAIYSYGSHFLVGLLVDLPDNRRVALITSNSYSVSTSAHISAAAKAVSNMTTFRVPLKEKRPESLDYADLFDSYMPRIEGKLQRAKDTRKGTQKYADAISEAASLYREANQFAEAFGLKKRLDIPADLHAAAENVADMVADRKKKAEIAAKRKMAKDLKDWRANKVRYLPGASRISTAYLRISSDGQTVETSQGGYAPAEHAKRAYSILAKRHARKETFKANGHTIKVGIYEIASMDAAGLLSIGCHRIEWSEVEWLAKANGWTVEPEMSATA